MLQPQALQILQQGHNVLLSGAAGSGKTYLINQFADWALTSQKNVALTASTGIAATHIDGTTIHNWSGIGVEMPANRDEQKVIVGRKVKFMYPRYRLAIREANILIIDEISMLHAVQLDMVDDIVRGIRGCPDKPFGGLQVILSGDFFQLPPIVNGDNNQEPPFVIKSRAFKEGNFKCCYLEEIHRQENPNDPLCQILNAMRNDSLDDGHIDLLRSKIIQKQKKDDQQAPILYTNNARVNNYNARRLSSIASELQTYHVKEEEKVQNRLYELRKTTRHIPRPLDLKKGAVVMCTKNDQQRKFFNGSLGIVTGFIVKKDKKLPNVRLNNGSEIQGLEFAEWFLQDGYNNRLATIWQVPLRLAWAITVHKSQGITLDAAKIYLDDAFVAGLG